MLGEVSDLLPGSALHLPKSTPGTACLAECETMPNMDPSSAIRDRTLISFTYDGLPRVVQPATYGYTTADNLALRGVLVQGDSKRNSIPCWELYKESKMVDLVALGQHFDAFAVPGYTRDDSGFKQIITQH